MSAGKSRSACPISQFHSARGCCRPDSRSLCMPYVNLQITKGATREQKTQLVRDITESLVRVLGKKPEHTHVVIQEIEEEDWGFAGMLTDDWKRTQASQ